MLLAKAHEVAVLARALLCEGEGQCSAPGLREPAVGLRQHFLALFFIDASLHPMCFLYLIVEHHLCLLLPFVAPIPLFDVVWDDFFSVDANV